MTALSTTSDDVNVGFHCWLSSLGRLVRCADVWVRNSFGALSIESTLTGWIDIPQSELETSAYLPTGAPVFAINQRAVSNAIIKALNILDTRQNLNGDPSMSPVNVR